MTKAASNLLSRANAAQQVIDLLAQAARVTQRANQLVVPEGRGEVRGVHPLRTAGRREPTYFCGISRPTGPSTRAELANHAPYHTPNRPRTTLPSQFARRGRFVETPAFLTGPQYPPGGSAVKRRILVALALVGLLSVVLVSRAGAAPPSTSPVTTFAGAVVGTSTLARTDSGIAFSLQTSGLQAGHAVTIWWMVFNPDGSVSVQYAAGHVVDEGGAAGFGGSLQEGDTQGVINGGPGLLDATGANVVLVVRDHGPADPSRVEQQIHTFGACNPTCTDLQISMHAAAG
jgi:hypothetical protein